MGSRQGPVSARCQVLIPSGGGNEIAFVSSAKKLHLELI